MKLEVCLVIPCYNEERRLPAREILDFVSANPWVSVCLVDDGSSDGTRQVLETLKRDRPGSVIVLALTANGGKAEAVRQGVIHVARETACGLIGYWDADLSTPLTELRAMLSVFERQPASRFVMGSRVRRLGSNIKRRAVRRLLGRVFSAFASLILDLPIYDSQCGAKLFRREIAETVFAERFITRWLFDVEILARLLGQFGREEVRKTTIEVPLSAWREVGGSKLRVAHMLEAPFELLRIRAHYRGRPS
jgi:dolichyl-phosphate beta-glucosyltransferase